MTQTIRVGGMTCDNCVRHVRQALLGLEGVAGADVDLKGGTATLHSSRTIPENELKAALEEAGYELRS